MTRYRCSRTRATYKAPNRTYWLRLYWLRQWRIYGEWFIRAKIEEIAKFQQGGAL